MPDAVRVVALAPTAVPVVDDNWGGEQLEVAVGLVDSVESALEHISRLGSGHTQVIVTEDVAAARWFVAHVDAAAVKVNAPTSMSRPP